MNNRLLSLFAIAVCTSLLICLFIPESPKPGTVTSLEGVTLSDISGRQFRLKGQITSNPVLLVFWSITCGDCINEIPFICELHDKLKDKLTIIGVHPAGLPNKMIKRFFKKYKRPIPYMLTIDSKGSLTSSYKVNVMPRIVLLDNQGRVLYDHVGYNESQEVEVENAIKALL